MKKERLALPILILALWQTLCSTRVIPGYMLPYPVDIVLGLVRLASVGMPPGRLLHNHLFYSLLRVAAGFSEAMLLGAPLGLAMGWSKRLKVMVNPVLEAIRPIPPLAWIPIAILWFGIGLKSAAFIIFLGAFFPILLNTIAGVESIEPIQIEAARMLALKGLASKKSLAGCVRCGACSALAAYERDEPRIICHPARTRNELEQALAIRRQVFVREQNMFTGSDEDRHDAQSIHLAAGING